MLTGQASPRPRLAHRRRLLLLLLRLPSRRIYPLHILFILLNRGPQNRHINSLTARAKSAAPLANGRDAMPSVTTISSDDKSKVKRSVPSSSNKIITATVARVYAACPDPNRWDYAGLEGALAFVRDHSKNSFFLRLVDLKVSLVDCQCKTRAVHRLEEASSRKKRMRR